MINVTQTFTIDTQAENPYIDGQKHILLQAIFQTLEQSNSDQTDIELMRTFIQHNQTATPFDVAIEAIAKKEETYDLFMLLDEVVPADNQYISVFEDADQHKRGITIILRFDNAFAEYASDVHAFIHNLFNQLYTHALIH